MAPTSGGSFGAAARASEFADQLSSMGRTRSSHPDRLSHIAPYAGNGTVTPGALVRPAGAACSCRDKMEPALMSLLIDAEAWSWQIREQLKGFGVFTVMDLLEVTDRDLLDVGIHRGARRRIASNLKKRGLSLAQVGFEQGANRSEERMPQWPCGACERAHIDLLR